MVGLSARLTGSGHMKPPVGVSPTADPVGAVGTLNRTWPRHPARKASLRAVTALLTK